MAWRSSKVRPGTSNRDLVIRPLGLGEIIDRAVALTVRHFRALFLWMLLFEAPAVAISRIQLAGMGEVVASLGDAAAALAALRALSRTSLWVLGAVFVLQIGATAVCAVVVAPSLLAGAGAGAGLALPTRSRRAAAVASAAAASLVAFLVVPAVGALPGLLLLQRAGSTGAWIGALALFAAGGTVGFLITVLRTLLVPAVAAVEGRLHFGALLRSFELMRSPPGVPFVERPAVRASLVLLATFVLALAVNVVVGVPRGIAGRLAGGPALLTAALPAWAEVPLILFETAATAALQPFSLVAVVVLYFDRRARREGLDLEAFAAEVEAQARGAAAP
jgi:hypothetical protein